MTVKLRWEPFFKFLDKAREFEGVSDYQAHYQALVTYFPDVLEQLNPLPDNLYDLITQVGERLHAIERNSNDYYH